MIVNLRCAWHPIAPTSYKGISRFFILNRHIYSSSLISYAKCLWYNDHKYDPFKLEEIDQYDDFLCDDYFLDTETLTNRFMQFKDYNILHHKPNTVLLTKDNKKLCVMFTPIDKIKTRVFIFFTKSLHKDIDSSLAKKMLKWNIRQALKA